MEAEKNSPSKELSNHSNQATTNSLPIYGSSAINIPGKDETTNSEEPLMEPFSLLNDTVLTNHSNATVYRRSIVYTSLLLPGEVQEDSVDVSNFRLVITNYRLLIIGIRSFVCSVPLLMIDTIEVKDAGFLMICRDGRNIHVPISEKETLYVWTKKLMKTSQPRAFKDVFAFEFYEAVQKNRELPSWLRRTNALQPALERLESEFQRFNLKLHYRISSANVEFQVCETYPQYLIVPSCLSDEELIELRDARTANRIPTVVWAYKECVLIRASQPSHSLWNGFQSNYKDISIMEKYRTAESGEPDGFVYYDLRAYSVALVNLAKGGGYEGGDGYNGKVYFKGMANIHNIRQCFGALRSLLNSAESPMYFQTLQCTNWFQHILLTLGVAEEVLNDMRNGKSVLVHCTDGWDRTTQIVALCMLIGDPYYRTFEGFEYLIQRQWVEFGHKFGDRSSVLNISGNANEISPIFLQFLDCVFQLCNRNPSSFQFNKRYLVKLSQHIYSGLFSTFLFNNIKEAASHGCAQTYDSDGSLRNYEEKAFPIWNYIGNHNAEFINPLFRPPGACARLFVPKTLRDLDLWREAYCCTPMQEFLNKMESNSPPNNDNNKAGNGEHEQEKPNIEEKDEKESKTEIDPANSDLPDKLENESRRTATDNDTFGPNDMPGGKSDTASLPKTDDSEATGTSKFSENELFLATSKENNADTNECAINSDNTSDQFPLENTQSNSSSHYDSLNNGSKNLTIEQHRSRTTSESSKNSTKRATTISTCSTLEFTNEVRKGLDIDGLSRIPIPCEDQMVEMFLKMNTNKPPPPLSNVNNDQFRDHSFSNNKTYISTTSVTPGLLQLNGQTDMSCYSTTNYSLLNSSIHNRLYYASPASTSTAIDQIGAAVSHTCINNFSNTRRVRNESIDSVNAANGFEFIEEMESNFNGNPQRRKHDSSGSLSQSFGQSPGMHFQMDGFSVSRSSGRIYRQNSPFDEKNEENDVSTLPLTVSEHYDHASNNSSLERGVLLRSSAASVTSLNTARSLPNRPELSGNVITSGAYTSTVKTSPGKLFNNGNLSGSANSLDDSLRPKGQTVAG